MLKRRLNDSAYFIQSGICADMMKPKEAKHLKISAKTILTAAIMIFLLIFIFSGYKLITYYANSKKEADAFANLAQTAQSNAVLQPIPEESAVLPQYAELYEQNPDLFGWIVISGTKIDYPVMHTPKEPEFYLRRAFDKTHSVSGVPFLSADCFEGCGNYLVYGHNLNNGTMFAPIIEYKDKKYFETHKTIKFNTLYEEAEYEIISAFRTKITANDKTGFRYWQYTDLTDKEKFDEYITNIKAKALYDTRLSAEFGDELLTLSTCSYHTDDGRFVVVAKKIK